MHARCSNKAFKQYNDYGGRGIKVCQRWSGKDGALNFITDMGPRPKGATVERRENDEDYSPNNCYWGTRKEQGRNKRNNLRVTYKGRTQCLSAWAEELGCHQSALYYRIVTAGWPVNKAMETLFRNRT